MQLKGGSGEFSMPFFCLLSVLLNPRNRIVRTRAPVCRCLQADREWKLRHMLIRCCDDGRAEGVRGQGSEMEHWREERRVKRKDFSRQREREEISEKAWKERDVDWRDEELNRGNCWKWWCNRFILYLEKPILRNSPFFFEFNSFFLRAA